MICMTLVTSAPTSTVWGDEPARPKNVKEYMSRQSRAKKGAFAGALAGALLGAKVAKERGDDVWKGIAAGAAAGGAVGFLIGRSRDKVYASRDQAVEAIQYDPSQGYVARIEEVRFDPAQPKPGQTASLYVRYLVVGPDPQEDLKVRIFRGLKYGDDYIMGDGPADFVLSRGGGIVESTVTVTLPAETPQGTYGVEALLDDPQGRFPETVGTSSLYVTTS
jgi:hypothetical protein